MKRTEFETIMKFYELLQDDESKDLFMARYSFMMEKNPKELLEAVFDSRKQYSCPEVTSFLKKRGTDKVIIYGCGVYGEYTYRLMQNIGVNVIAFVDADVNKQKMGYCGIPVLSPDVLQSKYHDHVVILASRKYIASFYDVLIRMRFPRENILWPTARCLFAICGKQYFDLDELQRQEEEVFIDAGSLNLATTEGFIKWCNGDYKKVYVFEPDEYNAEVCRKKAKDIGESDKIEIIECGTWSCDTVLKFHNGAFGGSKITDGGNTEIKVSSIDNVLAGKRCTFIKLDVEGAELETLKGAVETIKKWHPKLAISIYHKPEDVIQIPLFLMENFEGYKFYIRHYSATSGETVLYAI